MPEGSLPSHRITGLDDEQLEELATRLETRIEWNQDKGRPRKLTLRQTLRAILLYERQNLTQEVIASIYGVSQTYISIMTTFLEPHIEAVLAEFVPDPAESLPGRVSCIDGALLPCWSYQGHPELYSGKHHTTGHLVQVATDLDGAHSRPPIRKPRRVVEELPDLFGRRLRVGCVMKRRHLTFLSESALGRHGPGPARARDPRARPRGGRGRRART